jgi:hypothetical protein
MSLTSTQAFAGKKSVAKQIKLKVACAAGIAWIVHHQQ